MKKTTKYTQDILDEMERYDIWHTPKQLEKTNTYIASILDRVYESGIDDGVGKFWEWVGPEIKAIDKDLARMLMEDIKNSKADLMNWCMICNKPISKLNDDGLCEDCI